MPCDSYRWIEVEIRPAVKENVFDIGQRDKALLALALKELGITSYSYQGEQLTITTRGELALTVNDIKVAYSQQVVKVTAKRFGWAQKAVNAEQTAFTFAKR